MCSTVLPGLHCCLLTTRPSPQMSFLMFSPKHGMCVQASAEAGVFGSLWWPSDRHWCSHSLHHSILDLPVSGSQRGHHGQCASLTSAADQLVQPEHDPLQNHWTRADCPLWSHCKSLNVVWLPTHLPDQDPLQNYWIRAYRPLWFHDQSLTAVWPGTVTHLCEQDPLQDH